MSAATRVGRGVAGLAAVLLVFTGCSDGGVGSLERPDLPTEDFEYIIEPGNELAVQGAIRPLESGGPAGDGFVIARMSIMRGFVSYVVVQADDDDVWVAVEVHHPRVLSSASAVFTGEHVALALRYPEDLPRDRALAVAKPVVEALMKNEATLAKLWTARAAHGREPGRGSAEDTPAGHTPDGKGAMVEPGTPPRMPDLLAKTLTGENVLLGIAALFLLLVIASGRPAFLRRRPR